MPAAPIPAAEMALTKANLNVTDMKAVKTHNPFAVNDIAFSKKTGYDVMKMNNNGSSLIYGHPQGPTAGRAVIEMIEELVLLGGGYGLFTGCAAGDTAAALVLKVD
jgi:acetyl-CoA acetyltransferase